MLYTPFELAGKRLRNRIVHVSMTTLRAANAGTTPEQIQYYANRARGGAAMIVTEPFTLSPMQDIARKTRAWNDDHLEGLQRLADAVESQDCRLLAQVQDPGRGRHVPGRLSDPIGASTLPDDLSWTVPRALSAAEIRRMVEEFADSTHTRSGPNLP